MRISFKPETAFRFVFNLQQVMNLWPLTLIPITSYVICLVLASVIVNEHDYLHYLANITTPSSSRENAEEKGRNTDLTRRTTVLFLF